MPTEEQLKAAAAADIDLKREAFAQGVRWIDHQAARKAYVRLLGDVAGPQRMRQVARESKKTGPALVKAWQADLPKAAAEKKAAEDAAAKAAADKAKAAGKP